jgi:hypothetical protein
MKRADLLRLIALLATGIGCHPRRVPTKNTESLAVTSLPAGLNFATAWDFNGVIGTGQSLSVGSEGRPLRATEPAYHNLKVDLGGGFWSSRTLDETRASLVPLCEPVRPITSTYPGPYPRNIFGETPHTAMAAQVTAAFLAATSGAGDYVTVHSAVGESGQGLSVIAKNAKRTKDTGHAYEAGLFEARAIARLARSAGRTYGIGAVVLTHGETDAINPSYRDQLVQLARDYDVDLRAITGQTTPISLLASQQCSCPLDAGAIALSALALLQASELGPQRIVCVGPRYQYSYVADGVHLDALGYDQLGEKYGQVYFERVVCGRDWQPLAPRSSTRSGNVIDLEFHVPVPPLRWDEGVGPIAARPEWSQGRGFELLASGAPVAIEDVSLAASGTGVRIRYAGPPRDGLVVRYALSALPQVLARHSFRAGALCDSDPMLGAVTKLPQRNYAVMFERRVS